MLRTDIINALIRKYGYKTYLEIGIGDGVNYNSINCEYKENVDVVTDETNSDLVINKMTSDDFFKTNKKQFDIIFIDGLHTFEQTYIDIINALGVINDGGIILAHDTLPPTKAHQRDISEYVVGHEWNGTCWKAIARLRCERGDLNIQTVNTDWGVSIVRKGASDLYTYNNDDDIYSYEYFEKNKTDMMNIISVNDFIQMV